MSRKRNGKRRGKRRHDTNNKRVIQAVKHGARATILFAINPEAGVFITVAGGTGVALNIISHHKRGHKKKKK